MAFHKGARWNAEVNEEDYGKKARKEAIHAKWLQVKIIGAKTKHHKSLKQMQNKVII